MRSPFLIFICKFLLVYFIYYTNVAFFFKEKLFSSNFFLKLVINHIIKQYCFLQFNCFLKLNKI